MVTSGAGPPPPGAGDTTDFNEAGTHTVTFTQNTSSDLLRALAGDLNIGSDTTGAGTLNVLVGGVINTVSGFVNVFKTDSVFENDTTFNVTNHIDVDGAITTEYGGALLADVFRVGNTGTGTAQIQTGGTVSTLNGSVGATATAVGNVTIGGTGSDLTVGATLIVGSTDDGTLAVQNNGTLSRVTGLVGNVDVWGRSKIRRPRLPPGRGFAFHSVRRYAA